MVSKPQNVFVLRDVMANGYRMGGGTKFFGKAPAGATSNVKMAAIKKSLQDRLMNAEDITGEAPSLLAFPMETDQYEDGHMDTVMSVTSRLLPWETGIKNEHKSFPGGEKMFEMYNAQIGLRQVHFGEDIRAAENMDYISQGSTNNATCFIGPHRTWHQTNQNYSNLIPGQGHWGPDARPGDVRFDSPLKPLVRNPSLIPLITNSLLLVCSTGSLASRRVDLAHLGSGVDDELRAARVSNSKTSTAFPDPH